MKKNLLLVLTVLLTLSSAAFAVDRNVPGAYATIQGAIDASEDGDSVVVADDTYSGAGNYNIDFKGKAITVRSLNGATACIIDCGGLGRGFWFHNFETNASVLEGFTIRNGNANSGGGIECSGASPVISNCVIEDCNAYYGGAIDCFGGTPTIVDCQMIGNNAEYGGAVDCYNTTASILNCLIVDNGAAEFGAAIDMYGSTMTISNCTIINNDDDNGTTETAVYAATSTVAITNSIFDNTDDLLGCTASYSCLTDNGDIGGGNVYDDAMFRTGPLGDYYLSQIAAGQLADSPCINVATSTGIPALTGNGYTTRTDSVIDEDSRDMGYHYPDSGPQGTFALTAVVDGGNGSIDPEYISVVNVPAYSEIVLVATPATGYRTVSWTGADNTGNVDNNVVTMDGDKNVTVKFEFAEFTLTTIVVSAHGTLLPVSGQSFAEGEVIELTATPELGYGVLAWGGGVVDPATQDLINRVVMDSDKTVTVEFAQMLNLDVRIVGGEGDVNPRRGSYPEGTVVDLLAEPLMGVHPAVSYKLLEWVGTDDDASTDVANTITMVGGSQNVTVKFEQRLEWSKTAGVVNSIESQGSLHMSDGYTAITGFPVTQKDWEGYTIKFDAEPDTGYAIAEWYYGDATTVLDFANLPGNITVDPDDDSIIYVELVNDNTEVWVEFEYNIRVQDDDLPPADDDSNVISRHGTIQDAIDVAVDGQFVIVPDGTYSGAGNVDLDFDSKKITVQSENGVRETIIDCENAARAFHFQGLEDNTSVVLGFTIINGFSADYGGGILVEGISTPTIRRCVIRLCGAQEGGGAMAFIGSDPEGESTLVEDLETAATEAEQALADAIADDPADPDIPGLEATALASRAAADAAAAAGEDGGPRPRVIECKLLGNMVNGIGEGGGAIYYKWMGPIVTVTEMTGNMAGRFGGAVYGDSEPVAHFVSCLADFNMSNDVGGSFYLKESAATIKLCTIIGNFGGINMLAGDAQNGDPVGGVACIDGDAEISNCIIGGNGDDLYQCTAIFSDIGNGDAGDGNINADPMFVTGILGDYYLDQPDASPCVNAGELNAFVDSQQAWPGADVLGFDLAPELTTDVLEAPDFGNADMGYHYRLHEPEDLIAEVPIPFTLTVGVADENGEVYFEFYDPAVDGVFYGVVDFFGHQFYDPEIDAIVFGGGMYTHDFIDPQPGLFADFQAYPDPEYRVRRWFGADSPGWQDEQNTVTIDEDKTVLVQFEEPIEKVLLVPSQYFTLEEAFWAASSGDEIVLEQGTHYLGTADFDLHNWYFESEDIIPGYNGVISEGLDFEGRVLTVRSVDPDDPAVIANTIIDCRGSRYNPRRAFTFKTGEGADSIVTGLTIINGYMVGALGGNGTEGNPIFPPLPDENPPVPLQANSGESVVGDGYGGTILCDNGSSPTILNCMIKNSTVAGGQGGDGNKGFDVLQGPANAQSAGHAGDGEGNGYGGAVACLNGSNPTFTNCEFVDSIARGGSGGIGGNGGHALGGGRGTWGGNSGIGMGMGNGGSIYTDGSSTPVFTDILFENSVATLGLSYFGGAQGVGSTYPAPFIPFADGGNGMAMSMGIVAGGAVYAEVGNTLIYTNCDFIESSAYNAFPDNEFSYEDAYRGLIRTVPGYTVGGAIYSSPGCIVNLNNCNFIDSLAGAVRIGSNSTVNINDCLFDGNNTFDFDSIGYSGFVESWPYDPPATNTSAQAGALYIFDNCEVDIRDTAFVNNETDGNGAAAHLKTDATFTNCLFAGNTAEETGGAIDMHYFTTNFVGELEIVVPIVLTLNLNNCTLSQNEADYGGAINGKYLNLNSTDSYYLGNTAWTGGAIMAVDSDLTITGGVMSGNHATGVIHEHYDVLKEGIGGALACMNSSADITNCVIQDNKADAEKSFGGAIAFVGTNERMHHVLKNSLLTGNHATLTGGAIMCQTDVIPVIESCTFAGNTVTEAGGAIYCDWTAHPQISNSLFNNNVKYAVYEEQIGGDSSLVGNLFSNNSDGDYYDANTGQAFNGAAIDNADGNDYNLGGSTIFADGPLGGYYLDQSSDAVDAGVGSPADYDLLAYTTDPSDPTVKLDDNSSVDIGYHYYDTNTLDPYDLNVTIVSGHGTVTPATGTYYAGAAVKLTAIPQQGYRVKSWFGGTVNDSSTALENTVIMTGDKNIVVEFNQPRTIVVGSSNDYTDIQSAIDDAEDGDIVLVEPGYYSASSGSFNTLLFHDKNITLTSSNPDDSGSVAATVFDGIRVSLMGAGPETIIEGLTFTSGAWASSGISLTDSDVIIRNCVFTDNSKRGSNPPQAAGCSVDGSDGGSIFGGPLVIVDSSPQIINCVFRGNTIIGGNGTNGNGGCAGEPGGDGGWAGRAYGGAVFCSLGSEPYFLDCQFIDNMAIGGNGGNGGVSGAMNPYGGRGGNYEWSPTNEEAPNWDWWDGWITGSSPGDKYTRFPFSTQSNKFDWDLWAKWTGWDRVNSWDEYDEYYNEVQSTGGNPYDQYDSWTRYSGYGGAVYCEYASSAKFEGCTFRGNHTHGGLSGVGAPGPSPERPVRKYNIPTAGGAVYAAYGSDLEFINCNFTENYADTRLLEPDPENPGFGLWILDPDDIYISFGGAVAYENDCDVRFEGCEIAENDACLGGGIYGANVGIEVVDCNTVGNTAYHGAGIYTLNAEGVIDESQFLRNAAANLSQLTTMYGKGGAYHSVTSMVDITSSIFKENRASASGGAIYYGGSDESNEFTHQLFNSLFSENTAGRDGGAVSVNRNMDIVIRNTTIAENTVSGGLGDSGGLGGGLYVSYDSFAKVVDSVIWDNQGVLGSQLAIGSGDGYGARPSTVDMTHTDIGPITDPNEFIAVAFDLDDGGSGSSAGSTAVVPALVDGQAIYDAFDAGDEKVKVIVTLVEPAGLRAAVDWTSEDSKAELRTEIGQLQAAVLATLTSGEFDLRYQFDNQAGFSGKITRDAMERLLANSAVKHIEPVRYAHPALRQSIPLANATQARMSYDGTGLAVAIVDTGVDYTHPMLGGGSFPNDKVIGGYDTYFQDNDPAPDNDVPNNAHGTCCAGNAAGDLGSVGDYIGGVAHNAKIYALKASNEDGVFPGDAILAAWDWCVTHQHDDLANPIMVISNSLGGGQYDDSAMADASYPALAVAAENAVGAGMTVMAASGNEGFTSGISWPAAMSNVISVGAVFDEIDQVTGYSNTDELLDILAPADPMYTTDIVGEQGYDPGEYFPLFNGTSSACPFAAGCVLSIQNAAREELGRFLSPMEMRALLISSGDPITDAKVNITKPRVNLGMAISSMKPGIPIYVEDGCTLPFWDPNDQVWDEASFNIGDDPLFVGDHFLSEIGAFQLADSPAVTSETSVLASEVGLDTKTTRTDSVLDDGKVNMGYHRDTFELVDYNLNIEVIVDPFMLPDFDPVITPADGVKHVYQQYTQVYMDITKPPFGFHAVWTGTDDDRSNDPNNVVTMSENKTVTVQFESIGYTLDATVEVHPDMDPDFVAEITFDPPGGVYYPDTIVEMTVTTPPVGYQVRWTGADNNSLVDLSNIVTMVEDKQVTAVYELIKTDYYAVVVGIGDYKGYETELTYATYDAAQFYSKLIGSDEWEAENVHLLLNTTATKANIENAIYDLADRADHDDVFVFYFSGFGTTVADEVPADEVDELDEALVTYAAANISDDEMKELLDAFATENRVVIIDAGFSSDTDDNSFKSKGIGGGASDRGDGFADDLVKVPSGTIVLTASTENQTAWESVELRHGVFTYYLLQALGGSADWQSDTTDSIVTIEEAYTYLVPKVTGFIEDLKALNVAPDNIEMNSQIYDGDPDNELPIMSVNPEDADPDTYYVPSDAGTIQEAVELAKDGDLIILEANTYFAGGVFFDKDITITSTNPDDPAVVASTIINISENDQSSLSRLVRGVVFGRNTGPGAVLDGITIQSADLFALNDPLESNGESFFGGGIFIQYGASPVIKNCVVQDVTVSARNGNAGQTLLEQGRGFDGGSAFGAGIYCAPTSSPTIINTIVRNCHTFAGDGGNGMIGNSQDSGGRGGWPGVSRGGGIYVDFEATPVFTNCTVSDCSAVGGNAGNGGDGGFLPDGTYVRAGYGGSWSDDSSAPWQAWGYIGDYRYYSAYGGGVYCETSSKATFDGCLIEGNRTRGGVSGVGGLVGIEYQARKPFESYEIPTYGGGVYCSVDAEIEFVDCVIRGNVAPKPAANYVLDASLGHGGGIAFEETAVMKFTDCHFIENEAAVGGGIYWSDASPEIADCNVVDNLAYYGGGIHGDEGSVKITNTNISGNSVMQTIGLQDELDDEGNVTGTIETVLDTVDFVGKGGGVYLARVNAEITNTEILRNEAQASGGGLYFTGDSDQRPSLFNCLIAENKSGRDGAGISVNWYADPELTLCTIANNEILDESDFADGYGAGLYSSYNSNTDILYSIIWGNKLPVTLNGASIAVATGFENDPIPSTVSIEYSDVENGLAGVYVGDGCTFNWYSDEEGTLTNDLADPLFVLGTTGSYYLAQTEEEVADIELGLSPCVDFVADVESRELGMDTRTTTSVISFNSYDYLALDIGYHYPHGDDIVPDECWVCDFDKLGESVGLIDLADLAVFAGEWLSTDCDNDDWCQGVDLDFSKTVDLYDFALFTSCYLVEDTTAPTPDPIEWLQVPVSFEHLEPITTVTGVEDDLYNIMTAERVMDTWSGDGRRSEYYWTKYSFEYWVSGTDPDLASTFIWPDHDPRLGEPEFDPLTAQPVFIHHDVVKGIEYAYRVKAVDARGNETGYSTIKTAVAGANFDTNPPVNVEWRKDPYALGIDAPENEQVRMYALDADDLEGSLPITYLFVRYDVNASGVGNVYGVTDTTVPFVLPFDIEDVRYNDTYWSTSPIFTDSGLVAGETYQYHFYAKDSVGNVAPVLDGAELPAILTVVAGVDVLDNTPPTPDPAAWTTVPNAYNLNSLRFVHMVAEYAADAGGRDIQYYFECSDSTYTSTWRDVTINGVNVDYLDDEHLDGIPDDIDEHAANIYIRTVPPSGSRSWRVRARAIIRDNQGEIFPDAQDERMTDWSFSWVAN